MDDLDLIDVDSLDYSDDQTWLMKLPNDFGHKVDIIDWKLSCDWPTDDSDYMRIEKELYDVLDNILSNQVQQLSDKHKFDSRTYVKPKKRMPRPSIQNIMEAPSSPPSLSVPNSGNKYMTYNKYNSSFGGISPMIRLKTFNVDVNSENSSAVKEYAMKRRSFVEGLHDDDPQLEDAEITLASDTSDRLSMDHTRSKPINIDLSQPVHNLHNTFTRGLTNIINERGSLNMYQSGESLMRMSPPSLVSSLMMESSGNFNPESMESKRSFPSYKEPAVAPPRESLDPMMTSMTLSILDEKDMSTSFLSQTTYPDNDSLMDSLPPSLVSSVNSSYVVSNVSTSRTNPDSNIFSSATFTHLEQSEKLLSARPRCQLYSSFRKEAPIKSSESYTKAREEACQIDTTKILNENTDKKEQPKPKNEMTETITLHFTNDKFKSNDAEKENFERDDAFYKDMGLPKPEDIGRNSLNVTLGKQELNEIIQARQKLSLARKALPSDPKPNQRPEESPVKTIQLPNTTITVPKQSMENASELLSRRRLNGFDKEEQPTRETPKRNSTFKKITPKQSMDATVVYNKDDGQSKDIIDINSATLNLIDDGDKTLEQQDWNLQERAMVGSSDSTDTGTFSSSSPPESGPERVPAHDPRATVASTPLMTLKKGTKNDLLDIHTTISPIFDSEDKHVIKMPSNTSLERTYNMHNTTVINSATLVKKGSAKRDILSGTSSPDKTVVHVLAKSPARVLHPSAVQHHSMVPPAALPRKTGLPTSKLRQYSSHRELSRIPASGSAASRAIIPGVPGRSMVRRGVYGSNPALSPTHPAHDIAMEQPQPQEKISRPVVTNPPVLVRQGTETLRRERPTSQLVAPAPVRNPSGVPISRSPMMSAPPSRIYSTAGINQSNQLRVNRPASGPPKSIPAVTVVEQPRASALPRPSRLPAPRRALRPPSVYTVAPTADAENY